MLSEETSNALDSLSYKKHGNVAILLQHGNSHGFSQGKELDQRNDVLPLHRLHHFVNKNGSHTLRDQAVKEAALLHLWTYLKQDMYQQQTTVTQRIGHELSNDVFENVWQEHPFAKLPQRGLFLAHHGDCWSIQMRLEANNVTASALNNVRHAQMFLTRFFALWFGTCLFQEKHLEVGTCLKFSLYPRTTTSQAFLDYGWYTLLIQQGKRTIHSSGNWLTTAGNGTTQQVIAIVDVENKQLLSTVYCGRGTEQPRRISRRYSTTSPMPSLAVLKNLRLANLRLWLMWCERKYKTSQHENTSVSDWQVHSYGSTVRTTSWRQRSEAAHSQVTHSGRRLVFTAFPPKT